MRALRRASPPLYLRSSGLVTAVGLSARASAAALRAGVLRFQEIPFHDSGGNFVIAAPVPRVTEGCLGLRRLVRMLATAVRDAAAQLDGGFRSGLPLLLALSERERPGRPDGLDARLLPALEAETGLSFDRALSGAIAGGGTAVHRALQHARDLLQSPGIPAVVVGAVDSWLNRRGIDHLEEMRRLKTPMDPDGVIPGEGAAVLVLERAPSRDTVLEVSGLGFADEPADRDPERMLVGHGLASAIHAALEDAGCDAEATWFNLSDSAGDRRAFMESTYATARTRPGRHEAFPQWLPAESFGDIGAVSGAAQIAVAAAAFAKGYAPGPGALSQTAKSDGERAVALLRRLET